jgi:hypothetical protein
MQEEKFWPDTESEMSITDNSLLRVSSHAYAEALACKTEALAK